MVWLARIAALVIGGFALVMLAGIGVDWKRDPEVGGAVAMLAVLGVAVWIFLLGQRRAARDLRVALTAKMVRLAQESGTLTVPQVATSLNLTAEEAKAALEHLKSDGIAQFDVDDQGAPVYRVQKIKLPA